MGERAHQRLAGGFHLALVGEDVEIGEVVRSPLVGRLAIERAAAFERDIVQVFAVDEADLGEGSNCAVERGEECGAGFEIETDAGTEMQLAGGVFAGPDVNGAAAGFAAGVDGFLQRGAGVVRLVSGGAVIFDVEDWLCGNQGSGESKTG